jgi:membrane fusion protein, multidrug efflux system
MRDDVEADETVVPPANPEAASMGGGRLGGAKSVEHGLAERPGTAASAAREAAIVLDGPTESGLIQLSPPKRKAVIAHRRLARWGIWGVGAVGVLVGAVILVQFVYYRFTMSMTNDAFVESHIVHLAPQQAGLLTRVRVEEHDVIKAGQLLAEIDPVPLRRELEEARAKRKVAEATLKLEEATLARLEQEHPRKVAVAEKELASAQAAVDEARSLLKMTALDVDKAVNEERAQLAVVEAALANAREEYERFSKLFSESSAPERKLQDVTREYRMAQAKVEAARAKVERAEADREQVQIARLALDQKRRAHEKASEALRLAQLGDLEIEVQKQKVRLWREEVEQAARTEETVLTKVQNARIVAPFDCVVARRFRNPGDYAPLGAPVLSVYDPELVYVTAYLEEDRLEGVSPGNRVRIWVDAFPDVLSGRVVWIGEATGANFALLPRDVSSGEFTKVTQRVPVRIAVERGTRWRQLRPGLSVTVAISHGPGDPSWAAAEAERERTRGSAGVSPTALPDTEK